MSFNNISRVAIIFANFKGNLGDFAILDGMLHSINHLHKKCLVDVYPNPDLTVDDVKLSAFMSKAKPFEIKKISVPKIKFLNLISFLGLFGLRSIAFEYYINYLSKKFDASYFSNYEAIYIVGGDQWSATTLGIRMFSIIQSISKINNRLFAFPFSANPKILKKNAYINFKKYLEKINGPLKVRDGISLRVIEKLNIPANLSADIAYSLYSDHAKINKTSDNIHKKNLVLICVTRPKHLIINEVRELTSLIISKNFDVALLSTCFSEDQLSYDLVASQLGIKIINPLTWQDLVTEVGKAKLVITNRLHCLILGSFTETALIPITSRAKIKAYVEDSLSPIYFERINDINSVHLEHILKCEGEIVLSIKKYLNKCLALENSSSTK